MAKQSRSEKLERLVKVQRHLEQMAEVELANTTRARQEVQENLGAVVDAIGSLAPVHQIFAGLYSSQISRLTAKDQQLVALIDSADVLLDKLASRRDELATILGTGAKDVSTLADTIDGQRSSIDSLLTNLHDVLGGVQRQLPNVNTALQFAGPTFTYFTKAGHGGYFDVVGTALGPSQALQCLLAQVTGGVC